MSGHERHLIGHSGGLSLLDSLGVIDDLRADPDAGVRRGLHNRLELGLGDEVSLGLLDSLRRSVRLSVGLGINVDLRLGFRGGQGMLLRLGLVDDFSRNPDTRRGDELSGGHDLSFCYRRGVRLRLDLGLSVFHGLGHGHGGGYGHCLGHRLGHGLRLNLGLNLRLDLRLRNRHSLGHCFGHGHSDSATAAVTIPAATTAPSTVVDDNRLVASRRRPPGHGLAGAITHLLVAIPTAEALVTARHEGRVRHHGIDVHGRGGSGRGGVHGSSRR